MTKITLANASTMKKKLHDVLKPIKYLSKKEGQRKIGRMQEAVTFGHLTDAGYMTLIASNTIRPVKPGGKS